MVGKALHHVSLNVTDVRACVAFYEAMGFREIERPELGFDGAWMRIGDTGELHLLGSSVLITYEGDARFPTRPRVCVIDFCNYVEAHGETDENFARGLDRLAEMMEEIVAERRETGGGEGNGV